MRFFGYLFLLTCAAAAAASTTSVMGDWTTADHSVVRIEPCSNSSAAAGKTVCLTVIQVPPNAPRGKDGQVTDGQNPDPNLRSRPICGLVIGTGFQQTDPDRLADGKLYDPNSGRTYSGTIALNGDTLHLRGFIGVSLFGRTETWHRSPAITPCKA
ncbi:MAG: DUF2147 domain-containing protein [Acidobacteria bacterium]|nr:DUF2147 domain-containing protein [Acidobacteriota bacterium]